MIKWIKYNRKDLLLCPSKNDEYFVSDGEDITTAYWDCGSFTASCHVESTYDMAGSLLDMTVKFWAKIEDDMLPKNG